MYDYTRAMTTLKHFKIMPFYVISDDVHIRGSRGDWVVQPLPLEKFNYRNLKFKIYVQDQL